MKIRPALLAVACLALSSTAFAWNDVGHMTVARVAYADLKPDVKQKVDAIIKQLPHYDLLIKDKPADYADEAAYAFMRAATWPDNIRGREHPMNAEHHGIWHYIDFPVIPPGETASEPNPETKWDGHSEPTNAAQAFQKVEKDLTNPATTPDRRAISLCWVEHLVGDIHQPLHATSLFAKEFPKGDKGGNSFLIQAPYGRSNLHSYWDGLLGLTRNPNNVEKLAAQIRADKATTRQALADKIARDTTFNDWTKESYDAAVATAYQNAQLPHQSKELLQDANSAELPPLPIGYGEKARAVANERIALAGYRLADTLNELLGK